MVCITYQYVVCMYPIYVCASYYGANIDDYATLKTLVCMQFTKVTALLEMVCITYQCVVCMHPIYVLILCMHPIMVQV